MFPAVVLILFCQLLALFGIAGVSAARIKEIDKRNTVSVYLGLLALLTIVPAGWQTGEVWFRGAFLSLPSSLSGSAYGSSTYMPSSLRPMSEAGRRNANLP